MRSTAVSSVASAFAGIGMMISLVGCSSGGNSSSSPSATSNFSACSASVLNIKIGYQGASAVGSIPAMGVRTNPIAPAATPEPGSSYLQIVFTNTSVGTCGLYGYPNVAMTTSRNRGSQVGLVAARLNALVTAMVTLSPGAQASAVLQIMESTTACEPVSTGYLEVNPPGQNAPLYLTYPSKGCTKPVALLRVTAIGLQVK